MGYKAGKELAALADTELSTMYLKLEPIKEELTWTGGLTVVDEDVQSTSTTDNGTNYKWTFGSTVLTGLSTGEIIQFVEYDPITKCETPLWNGVPTITSTSEMNIEYLGEDERVYQDNLLRTRILGDYLEYAQDNPHKRNSKPRLKIYKLPANYVTKQINISTIQSYWQDPQFSNVMWLQHTACCSFTSGPFHPTVTDGEGEGTQPPASIEQEGLVSKVATNVEVFHNIIPLLDKIMTYAN